MEICRKCGEVGTDLIHMGEAWYICHSCQNELAFEMVKDINEEILLKILEEASIETGRIPK